MLGSPRYMAPEQITDSRSANPRADIWSLGVVLFRVLTGKYPFDGENAMAVVLSVARDLPASLERLRPEAPDELVAVVARALAKDPDERYQTMTELADALKPFGSGPTDPALFAEPGYQSLPALPVRPTDPPPRRAERPSVRARANDDTAIETPQAVRLAAVNPAPSGRRRVPMATAGIAAVAVLVGLGALGMLRAPATPSRPAPGTDPIVPTPPASPPELSVTTPKAPERIASPSVAVSAEPPAPVRAPTPAVAPAAARARAPRAAPYARPMAPSSTPSRASPAPTSVKPTPTADPAFL